MATKPETNFRKKVRADLDQLIREGKPLWFEAIQQKAIKGSPDFILCVKGQFVALELKSENGILSEIQEAKLKLVVERGEGIALIADPSNWQDTLSLIEFLTMEDGDHDITRNKENTH